MNHSKIINKDTTKETTKALWLSDLHLEKTTHKTLLPTLLKIQHTPSDIVIITGDISTAKYLSNHLIAIAAVAAPRPVYFVLGNHDYYGGSFANVEAEIKETCSFTPNLHFLSDEIIPVNSTTCIVGINKSWADARAGKGFETSIESPDVAQIKDFDKLSHQEVLHRMRNLGLQSADAIRQTLPLALSQYQHVVVMTHVPPFYQAARYNGATCSVHHQPHYVNQSMGLTIWGIAKEFLNRKITVLAGHTHSGSYSEISSNINIHVADAQPGKPAFETLIF